MTKDPRPQRFAPPKFPAPEFPPRRIAPFARMPPAIFPPILGLLGAALALRLGMDALGHPQGPGEVLSGVAIGAWAVLTGAYCIKLWRRPGVVVEDLRVLPGRSGLAAMTMGGMAAATLLAPFAPAAAQGLLVLALVGHAVLGGLLIRLLARLPPDGRQVNPTLHLSFVGFIVAGPAAMAVGWSGLAAALFWLTLPVAVVIWGLSARQFARAVPPAPLRPLLAIHVAPAALLSSVATLLGMGWLATGLLAVGVLLAVAIAAAGRWLLAAGVTPMWGALTFPMAVLAAALIRRGGVGQVAGLMLTAVAIGAVLAILWWVGQRWRDGRLSAITNAAEA